MKYTIGNEIANAVRSKTDIYNKLNCHTKSCRLNFIYENLVKREYAGITINKHTNRHVHTEIEELSNPNKVVIKL